MHFDVLFAGTFSIPGLCPSLDEIGQNSAAGTAMDTGEDEGRSFKDGSSPCLYRRPTSTPLYEEKVSRSDFEECSNSHARHFVKKKSIKTNKDFDFDKDYAYCMD